MIHRNVPRALVLLGLLSFAAVAGAAGGQEPKPASAPTPVPASTPAPAPAPARSVTRKVTPTYPDLARKAHLEGTVRLSVVVTPQGAVKSVAVNGGHPIFAAAATAAARQWHFTPAARESTQSLVFEFKSPDR